MTTFTLTFHTWQTLALIIWVLHTIVIAMLWYQLKSKGWR